MWKHILQISLIFCMFIVIAYIYRLNLQQITNKNKMIEKFKDSVENPKPYSNEDFVLYANIIGIFKTQIGKEVIVSGIVQNVFFSKNTLLFELFDSAKIKAVKFSPTKVTLSILLFQDFSLISLKKILLCLFPDFTT